MIKKTIFTLSLVLVGCSQSSQINNGSTLPSVSGSNGKVFMKAKAEFDLSSAPDGSAQFNLIKKTYASPPAANCLHGQCTDYSDITVTNSGSTQFALASHSPISQNTSNQNISNLVTLNIGTLFDNNLTSCGGQKCISAAIRIYTTDATGIQGAGLYSSLIGKSVPLTVSGGSSDSILASVPYFSAAGTPDNGTDLQIDLDPLAIDKNVLSLEMADFSDASPSGAGYILSADFTQAGSGIYQAHVVVEYDLIGSVIVSPSPSPSPSPTPTPPSTYVFGHGTGANSQTYWANIYDSSGNETTVALDSAIKSLSSYAVDNNGIIYFSGMDIFGRAAYWANNVEVLLSGNSAGTQSPNYIAVDSAGTVYVQGQNSVGDNVIWTDGFARHLLSDVNSSFVNQSVFNVFGIFVVEDQGTTFLYDGGDDLVAQSPIYFQDGGYTGITSSHGVEQAFAVGNDLETYAVGTALPSGNYVYWKNGVQNNLVRGNPADSLIDFYIGLDSSSNIYILSEDTTHGLGYLHYWKNGGTDQTFSYSGSINGYSVSLAGDLYVWGNDLSGNAVYWKNNILQSTSIANSVVTDVIVK